MIEPYALDRAITSASLAIRRARETLRAEPEASPERPLAGHDRVSRRDELVELADLAERRADEPMWPAAVPHVRELVLSRATFVDERREALARAVDLHTIESPVRGERTVASMLDAVMVSRVDALVEAWARTLEDSARSTQTAAHFLLRRRLEAARLIGDFDLDRHDSPVAEPALLYKLARGVLDLTSDVVPPARSWEQAIVASIGRTGHEGFPGKLTTRWLASTLPEGLIDGLAPDVKAPPRLLGASSFARALADLGGAIAAADIPRGLPRCIARAPHDLLIARRAGLFGALVAHAPFLRRKLELSRGAARDQASAAERLLLAALRLDAARVLAREVDPRHEGAQERTAEIVSRAMGAVVPPKLAYVVPRMGPGDAVRLVGGVLAYSDRERIVDALDDDWFASPRAADLLRHAHHEHRAAFRAGEVDIDGSLAALRRTVDGL